MSANVLRWDGGPAHYEVYYLSATDAGSATGLWIRYTMRSPLQGTGECSLWFMAMDRDGARFARKASHPIEALTAEADPFHLTLAGADLSDRGMAGAFEDVSWELLWEPSLPAAEHVDPLLRRAGIAKTILVLSHPDLAVSGTVRFGGRELVLEGARGGQAHLWGSKHATRWAWAHCNDFTGPDGHPRSDVFIDGVSVYVPRFGRQIGPNTPVVARVGGHDLLSVGPLAVIRNPSEFGLDHWRFEARAGRRKATCEVSARREDLVGVTYHDPDGELAYCYNTEVADMRVDLWERDGRRTPWRKVDELRSERHAHFEYAQRTPVDGVPLLVK
jgi:hypothetical protein